MGHWAYLSLSGFLKKRNLQFVVDVVVAVVMCVNLEPGLRKVVHISSSPLSTYSSVYRILNFTETNLHYPGC